MNILKLIGALLLLTSTAALGQNVVYGDTCSGSDIGARINTCVSELPTATSGYKVGTVILPNTSTEPSLHCRMTNGDLSFDY